ncbi:LOW QUALITY PROTEIN: hypothetical protein TorRG33x02_163790 [Trema orientale]|uniref:Uncharacterized protein n=1 Tax=Trema orientale TaxID=63057 RepID=A0A2P5EQK0_TREOI|nr:LOW QUALITY PROTEIN: hypothetical protein TorRG33x02_163790 [Trema orientale]
MHTYLGVLYTRLSFHYMTTSEVISRKFRLKGFNHVQKQISHTSNPLKQRVMAITSMHLTLGHQLMSSIKQKAGKCFGPV